MRENVTFPIGNIVLLDRIKKDFGYFEFLFGKIGGKAKDFQKIVKSLMLLEKNDKDLKKVKKGKKLFTIKNVADEIENKY